MNKFGRWTWACGPFVWCHGPGGPNSLNCEYDHRQPEVEYGVRNLGYAKA